MEDQPIYQTRRPQHSSDIETQEVKGVLGCIVSGFCLLITGIILWISIIIGINKIKTNETKTTTPQTEQVG